MTLSKKELMRYKVICQWMDGLITGSEAAERLQLSYRQVLRLKKRALLEGETGVIHKNRGRKPAHALDEGTRQTILSLHQSEKYKECNDVHFAELLAKYEGIQISPSTVRRIRREAHIPAKRKRRPPKAHRPRTRKPQAGMLVQMDGSFHPWLEDRHPPFSLLAAVDDATGKIVAAVFRQQEDTEGYFHLTRQMIEREGIPMSIYSDRQRNTTPGLLSNRQILIVLSSHWNKDSRWISSFAIVRSDHWEREKRSLTMAKRTLWNILTLSKSFHPKRALKSAKHWMASSLCGTKGKPIPW